MYYNTLPIITCIIRLLKKVHSIVPPNILCPSNPQIMRIGVQWRLLHGQFNKDLRISLPNNAQFIRRYSYPLLRAPMQQRIILRQQFSCMCVNLQYYHRSICLHTPSSMRANMPKQHIRTIWSMHYKMS